MIRFVHLGLCALLILGGTPAYAQWTAVPAPEGGNVTVLRSAADMVFAGTLERGLFVSRDDGATWEAVGGILAGEGIGDVVTTGDTIVAGGYAGSVFFSEDGGTSWTEEELPEETSVLALARGAGALFVGTLRGELLISSDGGRSWTAAGSSGGVLQSAHTNALAVDGRTVVRGGGGGIAVSTDGGARWELRNDGLDDTQVHDLVVDADGWYAATSVGVFQSDDDGDEWHEASDGLTSRRVAALAFDGTDLYAGTDAGVFRSSDDARSWTLAGSPGGFGVVTLAAHDGKLFAGTAAGVVVSSDGGSTWAAANAGLAYEPRFTQALIDGDTILAGSHRGLLFTANGGATWMAVGERAFRNDGPTAFATVGDVLLGAGSQSGVRRSTDGGRTWSEANEGLDDSCHDGFAVSEGTVLVACGTGVFRSLDGGRTWTPMWVDPEPQYNRPISAVAVFGTTWLAASWDGVGRSTDDGETWSVATGASGPGRLHAFAMTDGKVYVAGDPGVFVSGDDGVTWESTASAPEAPIHDLAAVGARLFLATEDGVYASADGGASWTGMSEGLPERDVRTLIVEGDRLYALTGEGDLLWMRADVPPSG